MLPERQSRELSRLKKAEVLEVGGKVMVPALAKERVQSHWRKKKGHSQMALRSFNVTATKL
jgi:hypothetical protein